MSYEVVTEHSNPSRQAALGRDDDLLSRITVNPEMFGGKPIVRGRRLAVEHVLGMLSAGSSIQELLDGYDWLEPEDIQACLLFATRRVAGERVEPALRVQQGGV